MLLDAGHRVDRQLPDRLRAPEDAVQDDEPLVLRASRQVRAERRAPGLDHRRRDVLDALGAEPRHQVRLDDRAVVAQRRRLAVALVGGVAQELRGRIGERRARSDHPRQRAAARLVEHVAQPRLRQPLGHVARRRAAALGPRRPDLALHLAPVGQAVLRVPDRSTRSVEAKDVARRRLNRGHAPQILRRSRDIFGTYFEMTPSPENTKAPRLQGFRSAPERIRTSDLRFRRPTLYPAELRALGAIGPHCDTHRSGGCLLALAARAA